MHRWDRESKEQQKLALEVAQPEDLPIRCIEVVCDGGILGGNPGGRSYGSFEVFGEVHRRQYGGGRGHTNNTAEVQTALEALYFVAEHCVVHAMEAKRTRVIMRCDSLLTCNWINRHRNPRSGQVFRLVELLDAFRAQARAFASVQMVWQPRELSVAVLGH